MSILLIDAGNSSIKWALLKGNKLGSQKRKDYQDTTSINAFKEIIVRHSKHCSKVVIVSVLGDAFVTQAEKTCLSVGLDFQNIVSVKSLVNISNAYEQVHKLGADRLVAIIAAYNMVNTSNSAPSACIIVDSGTATTIDAVDETGQHLGGLILPGVDLCSKSLLENTQQLANWNSEKETFLPTLFAKDTTEAISSASIFGQVTAIDGICERMEKEIVSINNDITVERFLCGGNAQALLPLFKMKYQLHQNLVLKGLQQVINSEAH